MFVLLVILVANPVQDVHEFAVIIWITYVVLVALAFCERHGIAIYRSVSPGLLLSPGSVGSLFTTFVLSTGSRLLGRASSQFHPDRYYGPVGDARSDSLLRLTAPGSGGGAMPEEVERTSGLWLVREIHFKFFADPLESARHRNH